MATFYIQLEDRLQKISGDLTVQSITRALGYTPSNFSGSFNDLSDNPLIQDDKGEFTITDEVGNIIGKVTNEGFVSIDFTSGEHKLSEKADVSYVDEKFNNIEIPDISFDSLEGNPFTEDESGELNVSDNNGNIIVKINNDGVLSTDFTAGVHKLSEKADKTEIPTKVSELENDNQYATEEYVNDKFNSIEIPEVDFTGYATEEYVNTELNNLDFYSIKNNPVINSEDGKLLFVDENGNIGLQLEADNNLYVKDVIAGDNVLSNKVDKIQGKGLSTEDFTTTLKNKLESLNNFDSTEIENSLNNIQIQLDTVLSGNTSEAIETFNEIIAFLNGVKDTEDLSGIIASIEQQIARCSTKDELNNLDFYSIKNNPIINSEEGKLIFVDESGNIGLQLEADNTLYVKDVIAGDNILSNKANKAEIPTKVSQLENNSNYTTVNYVDEKFNSIEIPEVDFTGYATEEWVENKHYITAAEVPVPSFDTLQGNPMANDDTGEFNVVDDLGNIGFKITSEGIYAKDVISGDHVLSNKVDNVDGKQLSTEDFTTSMKDKLQAVNVKLENTNDILPEVETNTFVKYVNQTLTEEQKTQARKNIDAVSPVEFKTINGESIFGSGNIIIEGGSGSATVTSIKIDNVSKTPSNGVVDLGYVNKKLTTSTSSSMTLLPNVYYRNTNSSLTSLSITLGSVSNSNIINEYFVEFTTPSSGVITISFPSSVKWGDGILPTWENGYTYQVSIVNNLGVIMKFK